MTTLEEVFIKINNEINQADEDKLDIKSIISKNTDKVSAYSQDRKNIN